MAARRSDGSRSASLRRSIHHPAQVDVLPVSSIPGHASAIRVDLRSGSHRRFFEHLAHDCLPGTTTRLRYLKLIDRFTQHLVNLELRADNPAATMVAGETWPEDEPIPLYLSAEDDTCLQRVCITTPEASFKALRNRAIVALFLASGVTASELRQLRVVDLDAADSRPTVFVEKHGPRLARRIPVEVFAVDVLRAYQDARQRLSCATGWLFVSTGAGNLMKPNTLLKCVRTALREAGLTAADESPRLLRNTYGRRQLIAGKTNKQVSSLLGLSSHRTATRLRQTLEGPAVL